MRPHRKYSGRARLLWDAGGLWALTAWEACFALGRPLAPITADQVAAGHLEGARLLLVPGGWPSLKYKALGQAEGRAVRDFVERGGFYLGLCGGAGLASVWDSGQRIFNAQAARLSGKKVAPKDETLERLWFPAPLQTGGQMALALAALGYTLLWLIRRL